MLQRSPMDWIGENRTLAAVIAISLVAAVVGITAVTRDDGGDVASSLRRGPGSEQADEITDGAGAEVPGATDGATAAEGAAGSGTSSARTGGRRTNVAAPVIPGTKASPPCSPRAVDETGVTDDSITVGQIVTDVNQLPQQLRPAHEGLKAFLDRVNAGGGVCGRTIKLEYRNDNLNPATHRSDYESLASRVFAFVANESLLESQDYSQDPPFAPVYTDGGEPVPDIGGLAFSYGRSQSAWHAGVVGSISPVLVGGGQFKYFAESAKSRTGACRKGGIVYLREPTGASQDQAAVGEVAAQSEWGADLGAGNTKQYAANLGDPVPVYEVIVDQMISDGMNCVFAYTDLGSSINLVRAMANRGVWPPSSCTRGSACFHVAYVPLAAYDTKFVADAGEAALGVTTFIPHAPLNETDDAAMRSYLDAIKAVPNARPGTFSMFGFASGQMLVEALQACGGAPTRACVMSHLRKLSDFNSGGLLGAVTPFRTTRVTFGRYGAFDWKHVFNCTVALRVEKRGGTLDFHRANPSGPGFFCDATRVARGTPG